MNKNKCKKCKRRKYKFVVPCNLCYKCWMDWMDHKFNMELNPHSGLPQFIKLTPEENK